MSKSKAPSQRQLRVGELVRHALTEVLSRETIEDPALNKVLISVSEVRMSPDLKIATCFINPMGGRDAAPIIKALAKNAKFIRGRAATRLKQMKYMPSFRFLEDTSFDNFAKIDALLRSEAVRRDTQSGE
ncbi:MAG: ribosome-binding factor A [Hyphomicrobiales bacterium]|nr:30S ribosome-binding factor RbfA [Ahrensia sp. AH-315-G08]PCH45393.1 MAG: ribosome-binding factor A [Hyphomicrobiales bacterium]